MITLTEKQKTVDIPQAIAMYIAEKNTSQAQLGRVSKVGESYMHHIIEGKTTIPNNSKKGHTVIKDKYYKDICNVIGFELTTQIWQHFATHNFSIIIDLIEESRKACKRLTIDGDTGAGKTYAVTSYKKKHPNDTYVVTCSAIENSKEFAINIGENLGVETHGTAGVIIKRVINKLLNLDNPILIVDEAEHCEKKQGYINVIKTLADGLDKKVGLVLTGMGINDILKKGYDRKKQNFRQTARRFNNKVRCVENIEEDIVKISETYGLFSIKIQNWLKGHIKNFGDLELIIEGAFDISEKHQKPITTDLLYMIYYGEKEKKKDADKAS